MRIRQLKTRYYPIAKYWDICKFKYINRIKNSKKRFPLCRNVTENVELYINMHSCLKLKKVETSCYVLFLLDHITAAVRIYSCLAYTWVTNNVVLHLKNYIHQRITTSLWRTSLADQVVTTHPCQGVRKGFTDNCQVSNIRRTSVCR